MNGVWYLFLHSTWDVLAAQTRMHHFCPKKKHSALSHRDVLCHSLFASGPLNFALFFCTPLLSQGWRVGISWCSGPNPKNVRLKWAECRSHCVWALNNVGDSHDLFFPPQGSCFSKGESDSFPWYSAWSLNTTCLGNSFGLWITKY